MSGSLCYAELHTRMSSSIFGNVRFSSSLAGSLSCFALNLPEVSRHSDSLKYAWNRIEFWSVCMSEEQPRSLELTSKFQEAFGTPERLFRCSGRPTPSEPS